MKTSSKKYAAALVATIVLGFGAVRFLPASAAQYQVKDAPSNAAAGAEMDKGQGLSLPSRQWNAGASYQYELDTKRGMTIHKQDAADQALRYRVMGQLTLTVMGQDGNQVRLRADLLPKSVDVTPNSGKNDLDLLAGTFYLIMTTRGEIKEYFFPKSMAVEARTLLSGIVNSLQILSTDGNSAQWQTIEADVSGQYSASYIAKDAATLEKSKNQYLRTRSPSGFLPMQKDTQYAVNSKAIFSLNEAGWPKSLSENEALEVSAMGMRVTGNIESTMKLAHVAIHPEWIGNFPEGLESEKVSEAVAAALSKKNADISLVGGRSFEQIALELNATSNNQRSKAQARMAALFRVNPNEAKNAMREVLHGAGDDNSKRRLIGALGNAGTPEAQHELVRLLETQDAGELRSNAAVALGLSKNPSNENLHALDKAADSKDSRVTNAAILATGNAVRNMNADQSGNTADAVQMLIDGLANASTDAQKNLYLDALGNTGDARALVAITPYLTNSSAPLRATATTALKFMAGSVADQAIVAAFSDSEMLVRRAAVFTVAFRPVAGVLLALDTLLKNETEMTVRMEILTAMNTKLAEESAVIDSVTWAMENDPSPKVREFAKKIAEHVAASETN